MHSYVAEGVQRGPVLQRFGVVAICAAITTRAGVIRRRDGTTAKVIPAGVLLAAIGALLAYDRGLWRRRAFGRPLSSIPDVGGDWIGEVHIRQRSDSGEESSEVLPCDVRIRQTWSRMLVTFDTEKNRSESVTAVLNAHPAPRASLSYVYRARLKGSGTIAGATVGEHSGFQRLTPVGDGWNVLEGSFTTDEHADLLGTISIRRRRGGGG